MESKLEENAKDLARALLHIGAIKINPVEPFQWASGYRMPIYNDNRLLLERPLHRKKVANDFIELLKYQEIRPDIIAGVATAGIPHATYLANELHRSLIYVREAPKSHGMQNRIEGLAKDRTLEGKTIAVVEDLISTGGSSAKAVQAIRDAKGNVECCLAIFSYGFPEAQEMFEGKREYEQGKTLEPCKTISILTYDILLQVALERGDINKNQIDLLNEWRESPFKWGEKHGFPKILKS